MSEQSKAAGRSDLTAESGHHAVVRKDGGITVYYRGEPVLSFPDHAPTDQKVEEPHPTPWRVAQSNVSSPTVFQHKGKDHTYQGKPVYSFKPVYILDAEGERVLGIGDDDTYLPLAHLIVASVNAVTGLAAATKERHE